MSFSVKIRTPMFDTHTITEDDDEIGQYKTRVYYYDEDYQIDNFLDRLSQHCQHETFFVFVHRPTAFKTKKLDDK